MRTLATIGVYGWTLPRFLDALRAADVALVVDVRQRRGVRGSEYAWANAVRLQQALAEAGIAYSHHKELAPTTELRQLQYRADDELGVGKRSRTELAPEYRERYLREILDAADIAPLPSSASSATRRPATALSSRSGWPESTASRSRISAPALTGESTPEGGWVKRGTGS